MHIDFSCSSRDVGSLRGHGERFARSCMGRSGRTGRARPDEQHGTGADGSGGLARRVEDLALGRHKPGRLALTQALLEQATAAVFMELAGQGDQQGDQQGGGRAGQVLDRRV